MHIDCYSSNRNEWPLGTGRSPMHGQSLTDMRRRTTHGPKGTAQGNRGSAAQGGIRANPGFLPFKTSAIAVGACVPAGLVLGAAIGAVTESTFNIPLFREPFMSLSYFLLGCVVVSIALLAHVLVSTVSTGLAWLQPRTF